MHGICIKLAFYDNSGLSKTRFEIALSVLQMLSDVCGLVAFLATDLGRAQFGHQNRRIILHGCMYIQHGWKQLIFDFDQREGFLSNMNIVGGHGSHGMPVIQHLILCHQVLAKVTVVDRIFASGFGSICGRREVRARDDRKHPRQLLGRAGVN